MLGLFTGRVGVHAALAEGEVDLAVGEALFETYCNTCHGQSEAPVGPSLHQLEKRTRFDWVTRFVHGPQVQIDAKDPRALALVEKYSVVMPGFPFLSEVEIGSILAYVNAVTPPEVEDDDRERNRAHWKALLKLPTEPIPMSDLAVTVEAFVTLPPSSSRPPLARISNLRFLPGEQGDRFYVIDQNGLLYLIADGVTQPVLDVAAQFPNFVRTPGKATGFGCLAFHPEYRTNGRIYVTHTERPGSQPADFTLDPALEVGMQYVLAELTVSDPDQIELSGTWRELLRIDIPHQIHGMQDLCFKPDIGPKDPDYGLLFLGVGDGGSTARSAYALAESLASPLASILRIDPLGSNSRNGHYGIPDDNPFVARARTDVRLWPEVYAKGFRNPHRLTWEPSGARRLIATDIGQSSFEEVNLIEPGAFYGWNQREGFVVYDRDRRQLVEAVPFGGPADGYEYPVALYSHQAGFAISGGHIYDGDFAPLKGKYLFGDIATGRIFFTALDEREKGIAAIHELGLRTTEGTPTTMRELVGGRRVDLRLAVDAHGQWYVLSKTDGKIRRMVFGGEGRQSR